jgi:hypothetical protein
VIKLLPPIIMGTLFAILGVRLLKIGFRSGGSERWLACFFLFTAVGIPTRMLAINTDMVASHSAALVNVAGHVALSISVCCFVVFNWRVFRPRERWAAVLGRTFIILQVLTIPFLVWAGGHHDESHPSLIAANACRMLVFSWGFAESCLYWRQMVRRRKLGMADPIVANRFALYSVWTGALFSVPLLILGLRIISRAMGIVIGEGAELTSEGQVIMNGVRLIVVISAPVAFAAMTLSFFPPKVYTDRIMRSAEG